MLPHNRNSEVPRELSAALFFYRHASDGRAIILVHDYDDEEFGPAPQLWLCRLNRTLVAVDDIGPNYDKGPDEGFLMLVPQTMTVGDVIDAWRKHRNDVLDGRQCRRGRRPRGEMRRLGALIFAPNSKNSNEGYAARG